MANASSVSGRCLCGAVTFSAQVKMPHVDACHCTMCQRWSAGPLLALECVPGSLSIAGEDNLGVYQSSAWANRCFCKTCGSALFWRLRDGRFDAVSAGALDEKAGLKLTSEIFIDDKPGYYDFANATKRMTGAEFLASIMGPPEPD